MFKIKYGSSLCSGVKADDSYQIARKCSSCKFFSTSLYVTVKGNCSLNNCVVWHNNVCDGFDMGKRPPYEKVEIVS